jgi:hypothetical protein
METGTSIKITYWAEQSGEFGLYDFDGIDEFRQELTENYVAVVLSRPGALGGLHQLAIEIISNLTFVEVSKLLLSGIAFDLIKSGTKAFVLRPFLNAYHKLARRNTAYSPDISDIRLVFQDTTLVVYRITDGSIFLQLEQILTTLAKHSSNLTLRSGERPFEIHIPIFEDPEPNPLCRFRVLLDVDEPIRTPSVADYFRYWGIHYDFQRNTRVYDVQRSLLLDQEFFTAARYWAEWHFRQRVDL